MKRSMTRLGVLLCAASMGCAAPDNAGGGNASTGGVALRVNNVAITYWMRGSIKAAAGQHFVLTNINIQAGSNEIEVGNGFSVELASGVIVAAGPRSDVAAGCVAITGLAAGASATCDLSFPVPLHDAPAWLRHDSSRSRAQFPALPAEPVDYTCALSDTFNSPAYSATGQLCLQDCLAPNCTDEESALKTACATEYEQCRGTSMDFGPDGYMGACGQARDALDACAADCISECRVDNP